MCHGTLKSTRQKEKNTFWVEAQTFILEMFKLLLFLSFIRIRSRPAVEPRTLQRISSLFCFALRSRAHFLMTLFLDGGLGLVVVVVFRVFLVCVCCACVCRVLFWYCVFPGWPELHLSISNDRSRCSCSIHVRECFFCKGALISSHESIMESMFRVF